MLLQWDENNPPYTAQAEGEAAQQHRPDTWHCLLKRDWHSLARLIMRAAFHMPATPSSPPHILQLTQCALEGCQALVIKLLSSLTPFFKLGFIAELVAQRDPLLLLIRNKDLSGNLRLGICNIPRWKWKCCVFEMKALKASFISAQAWKTPLQISSWDKTKDQPHCTYMY